VQLNATQRLACLFVFAACSDHSHASADAGDDAPPASCWPDDGTTPAGSAVLGTGTDAFEPMPAMLPLEFGSQQGFDLVANVTMNGLVPGDPSNVFATTNPRTRIRAYFADTNIPLNYYSECPWTYGYAPTGDGSYVLPSGVDVIFETCWQSSNLIGKQVRIDLELVDSNDQYAHASTTVTLAAPTTSYPMIDSAGCMH
jgi:hypothetical protein